jgi:transmembrane sensor
VTPADGSNEDVAPLRMEAFDWASRLAIGSISDTERRAFDNWHGASPAHAEAYRSINAFMTELRTLNLPLGELDARDDGVIPLRRPVYGISRRNFIGGGAIAASAAASVFAVQSPLGLWPTLAEIMADERTGIGERRSLSPVAGVNVELNARSSLSWIADGARLIAGEMFVSIGHRTPSFRVEAGAARIAASHATFNVNDRSSGLCVSCLDGALSAERDGQRVALQSGESVTWSAGGEMKRTSADLVASTAWRRGLLVFKGTPLASAIGDINRYFPGKLVLRGSALGARPVTGVFHVDQIELAVVQIQQLTGASATRLPGGIVLLG